MQVRCSSCGASLLEGAQFCGSCGAQARGAGATSEAGPDAVPGPESAAVTYEPAGSHPELEAGPDPLRSPRPDATWPLILAIATAVFCCQPFGIVAIVFAAQASSLITAGDYAAAEEKIGKSKFWALLGIGIMAVLFVLYFGFVIVMMVASNR